MEASENTPISKQLMASKIPMGIVFWGFLKYMGFRFLIVTETALVCRICYNLQDNLKIHMNSWTLRKREAYLRLT